MEKGLGAVVRSVTRAQFIRGNLRGTRPAMRPPWAIEESAFVAACSRCDRCIVRCPTGVLVRGSGGFPQVDFHRAECSFCGECANACQDAALRRTPDGPPWNLAARVTEACLAHQRVLCRSCGEVCETKAIRFAPRLGGMAVPDIETSACSGCGACVGVCPAGAISMGQGFDTRQA